MRVVTYLTGHHPHTKIGCKTLKELWSDNLSHNCNSRIFDCSTYADLKTNNLEPRAIKCTIFMGCTSRVKEYGLWCTDMHSFRFMNNRDAIFYEDIILDVGKQMEQIETCSNSGTIQMESKILSRKKGASNSSKDMDNKVMEQQIDFEDIMGCASTSKSDYVDMVAYTLIVKYGVL